MNPGLARTLWQMLEPLHAVVYFAPEAATAYAELGIKGWWTGYFASRAGALGPVGPAPVTALFHGFAPAMVERALPYAWTCAAPDQVLGTRLGIADVALRRALGDVAHGPAIAEAAELAWAAVDAADPGGRALFAAHADLPRPTDDHLSLWAAATCLREHRGDGHVAALVAEGIDGCEANVLITAAGVMPAERQREVRGWSADAWAAAAQRLRKRGALDGDGGLTATGARLRDGAERRTDILAAAAYAAAGEDVGERLAGLLRPLCAAISSAGGLPYPNPIGVPPVDEAA